MRRQILRNWEQSRCNSTLSLSWQRSNLARCLEMPFVLSVSSPPWISGIETECLSSLWYVSLCQKLEFLVSVVFAVLEIPNGTALETRIRPSLKWNGPPEKCSRHWRQSPGYLVYRESVGLCLEKPPGIRFQTPGMDADLCTRKEKNVANVVY